MNRLFGTDGIRGVAGRFPLTPSDVERLGVAAAEVLKKKTSSKSPRILIVRDTRASGKWISSKLATGLRRRGVDVVDADVLCTPSVAFLVKAHGYQAGAVISASHNPPEFNGIKFFTPEGCKWPDAWEKSVEDIFGKSAKLGASRRGSYAKAKNLHSEYENFLVETLGDGSDLSGLRIAVDCSNGANSYTAPAVLRRMGAKVFVTGAKPNGKNINVKCGSQHTEKLSALVLKNKCHVGVAFDGDGDRVILVDEKGKVLDGDHIIAFLSQRYKHEETLVNNTVVITVMANLGLKKALKDIGANVVEVSVGDRYVSEAMRDTGSILGGEQSGHIILGSYLPTGDGLLTALHVLSILKEAGKPLSQLLAWVRKYPQTLLNLPVKQRTPLPELDGVTGVIEKIERELGDDGRVLVRYSGTEPLLRIMIEAADKEKCDAHARSIASAVIQANGAAGG